MQEKTMIRDMTSGNITRQLITFSIPFMIASFLQTLYSTVDMMVVGQWDGSAGLSAVSVGSQLILMCTMLAFGFSNAAQVMIAQYVGAGEYKKISTTIGTAMTFMLCMSIVIGLICLFFARPFLNLLNTPDEAMADAIVYMRICGCGMPFIYGYNIVSAFMRGMGDSKRPLMFIGVAAAVNIVMDLVLVGGFGMGATGAACATVLGQTVSVIWSLNYLYRRREIMHFDFKLHSFKIHGKTLKSLCSLGFPMALQSMAVCISALVCTSFINTYGVAASAITGVGQKLMGMVNVISNAVGTAMSTMVGQNMAAGKPERVRKLVFAALKITVTTTGIISILCLLFPQGVVSLFNTEEAVLELAPVYIRILVLAFIAGALMNPFNGVISGIGYASLALVIGLMDGVVARIGLLLLFGIGLDMGLTGFWLGDALAGFVTVILAGAYFFSGRWQNRKLLTQK